MKSLKKSGIELSTKLTYIPNRPTQNINVSITRTYLLQILSKFQEAYNQKLLQVQSSRSGKKKK